MPDYTDIEQFFKENDIDIENLRNVAYQLQKNNDLLKGGLRSSNMKQLRSIYVINAQDSLDATYPLRMHLNIVDEMVKIVSIKLSFWLLPFRAYSTTVPSGGGDTTVSGGGSTSGGGGDSTGAVTTSVGRFWLPAAWETVTNVGTENLTGKLITGGSMDVDVPTAVHKHALPSHTHTTPNHQHATPAHAHDITFGIHEEDNSPTIGFQISRDNGETYGSILGKYTADVANLEIKDYIAASGSYIIKFTSSARARLSAQLTIKLDITAR